MLKILRHSILSTVICCAPSYAYSFTMHDAVILAHENNYQILSEQENYSAAQMAKPKAYSGLLPNVSINSTSSRTKYKHPIARAYQGNNTESTVHNLVITQPLFNGGDTYAQVKIADNIVEASRYRLKSISNSVTLQTIQTYENVLASREVYRINRENEKIFAKYLEYTKTRFDAGVVTKTDVLQAEVRYSESIASKEKANADMLNADATMMRLIGQRIEDTMENIDVSPVQLPANVDELMEVARYNNPALLSSKYNSKAAKYQINSAVSRVLPTVTANAQLSKSNDSKVSSFNRDGNTYSLQVRIPLFQGGAEYASIKEQVHLSHKASYDYKEVEREVIEQSIAIWNNYKTSKAIIKSREEGVSAAALALEGVQEEVKIGSRTTIDLLNAEKELFDAKVSHRIAKRDHVTSIYQMLQLMGSIEAVNLDT